MVRNPPTNAEDMGLIPGWGRSHMPWSNRARALQLLSSCSKACAPQQEKSLQREAHALRLESSPSSLHMEKAHVGQQRPINT